MSKRFGRNQKRKLTKALEDARHDEKLWRDKVEREQRANYDNTEAVKLTREVLGDYFPSLPPSLHSSVARGMDHVRIAQITEPMVYAQALSFELGCVRANLFRSSVEVSRVRSSVSLFVDYAGKEVCLAMSPQAIASLPALALHKILSRDLVPLLVAKLKEGMKLCESLTKY